LPRRPGLQLDDEFECHLVFEFCEKPASDSENMLYLYQPCGCRFARAENLRDICVILESRLVMITTSSIMPRPTRVRRRAAGTVAHEPLSAKDSLAGTRCNLLPFVFSVQSITFRELELYGGVSFFSYLVFTCRSDPRPEGSGPPPQSVRQEAAAASASCEGEVRSLCWNFPKFLNMASKLAPHSVHSHVWLPSNRR
jgi:hypothetical protein